MTWIKLNDNVPRHPKIAGLSHRAFRYWINGLCYASEFLTDGSLPRVFQETVPLQAARELLATGLWIRRADGSLLIHDYLEHQRSRDQVARERERNTTRRTGGITRGTTRGGTAKKPRPELEESTEDPPNPPSGGLHVRREYRDQAKVVLRSRLGYCQHDPPCLNQEHCRDLIAQELARKAG
jgi:hypothetical protein